ncbi:LLM class flavin-dependent oxidoreductase [Streptomyces sp. NPDC054865]
MELSMMLDYAGDPRRAADGAAALEAAGLDALWVAEAWGFDSPTIMGYLAARGGAARRAPELGPLETVAGGRLAIGADAAAARDLARPQIALYVGGMGAPGKNFYNDLAVAYGYGEEARKIQELYLSGRKRDAAAAVPDEFCELMTLCGPEGYVRDRIEAFREAGVTMLNVTPVGPEPARLIETVKNWL